MDSPSSPRPSEAETFVDQSSNTRLLEEFTIDSNSLKAPSSRPIPPLFTSAHSRAYRLISAARIAVFVLNLAAILIPVFGTPDPFDSALFPITIFTSFICVLPTLLPMIFHFYNMVLLNKKDEVREQAGSKRSAILVEDPITGEERWMLEPKEKSDGGPMRRVGFAIFDVCCGTLLLVSIALSVRYGGMESPKTMGWAITDRALMLVLVGAAGLSTYRLMGAKGRTDGGSETNDYE